MGQTRPRFRAACQRIAALAFALAPALAASTAGRALAEPGAGSAHGDWMGAFWGLELRGGLHLRHDDPEPRPAPLVGVGLRLASLLTLLDGELYVQTAAFERGLAAGRYDLRKTSIALDLRLHPLFVRQLHGDFTSRALAGLHLALGLGADLLSSRSLPSATAPIDRTDLSFALAVGAGAEIPLTDPDQGGPSLWLGLGWRMRFVGFARAPAGLRDHDAHEVVLSLGLRFHDISFARIAPPPELDDRDR